MEILWRVISAVVFQTPLVPWYGLKRALLRFFGAKIGKGVLIKPRVTITFPWKVSIGDYSWIGEEAWLDALAEIRIGEHVCLSQRVYLCTGNHDHASKNFDLRAMSIHIDSGAWVAAGAVVGPGVRVGAGSILALGSVATQDLESGGIYQGNPAQRIGRRVMVE